MEGEKVNLSKSARRYTSPFPILIIQSRETHFLFLEMKIVLDSVEFIEPFELNEVYRETDATLAHNCAFLFSSSSFPQLFKFISF